MTIRRAVVLAAGRGARLGTLTENTAKAMVVVDGKTFLEHVLDGLRGLVDEVYVTVGYRGDAVASHAVELGATGVISTAGQGNAWWIHHSLLGRLDGPILLSTCDATARHDLPAWGDEYDSLGSPPCLLLPVVPAEGVAGDYIFAEGDRVLRLARDEPAPTYCSGLQILDPARVRFATSACDDFTDIWEQLAARDGLYVSRTLVEGWRPLDATGAALPRASSIRFRASSK